MKNAFLLLILGASLCAAPAQPQLKVYPERWFYLSTSLRSDQDVEKVRSIVKTAAEHGLNGMVFSAGLDRLDLQPPEYMQRLQQVRRICAEHRVDIIPSFLSAAYGSSVLAHDKNLAAGLPVKDALFVVTGNEARLAADPGTALVNGGFEQPAADRIPGFEIKGQLGDVISVDRQVYKTGKAALRISNFERAPGQSAGIVQEIGVRPYRCYRLRCWVKSENLNPADPFGSGNFTLEVRGASDDRRLQYLNPSMKPTGDWHEVAVGFNSWGYDRVRVSPTVDGSAGGKFWMDDLRLEEVGLVNVLRRPGTPLTVRGEKNGTVYEENRDYEAVADPGMDFRFGHDGPPIRLKPGTRIRDGERLRVSYYHGVAIYRGQTPVCMSEPKLYEIWRTQVRLLQEALAPQKYLLSMDEMRVGGSCEACKRRHLSMGEIFSDCVTQQFDMIRKANPRAEVFVWSDMLDPNHNANPARKYYYLAEGNFADSWKHVPKDINIACWYYDVREKSLQHFSSLGFRTLGAAYYDADSLENPEGWLKALDATPGACGIMYTTWLDKYALLAAFGDLVSRR